MNKDFKLLLILLTGFMLLASCESKEPECYEPVNVNAYIAFKWKKYDSVEQVVSVIGKDTIWQTVLDSTFRDTILRAAEIQVIGEDSTLRIVSNGNYTGVPFNPAKDTIRYRFRVDTAATLFDTLVFYYDPVVHFVSNNCGYTYYFNLRNVKVTGHAIDSSSLVDINVTNDVQKRNVQLYLKR